MSYCNDERLSELRRGGELVGLRSVVDLLHTNQDDISHMIMSSSSRLFASAHAIWETDRTGRSQTKFLFTHAVSEQSVKNHNGINVILILANVS